jgi:adenine phosphoribosyltransferase
MSGNDGRQSYVLNFFSERNLMTFEDDLQASVRTIPDYPKPGIMFRDITTLLGDARAFRRAVDQLVHPWAGSKIDKVAGIEARGFILGGADKLRKLNVPVRTLISFEGH